MARINFEISDEKHKELKVALINAGFQSMSEFFRKEIDKLLEKSRRK